MMTPMATDTPPVATDTPDDTFAPGGNLDNWTTPQWAIVEVVSLLRSKFGPWVLIDPGAGTGIIARTMVDAGLQVRSVCTVETHPGRSAVCSKLQFPVPHVNVKGDWLDPFLGAVVADWARGQGRPMVVGNPPYTKPDPDVGLRFIEQSIHVVGGAGVVALLLPLDFAAGVDRAERIHDKWQCSCYPLRRRPQFGKTSKSTGGKRPVAWFVWDLADPVGKFAVL